MNIITLPALTEVTGERALVTMAKFDVDLQGREGCTRHVTEWAFYVIHLKKKTGRGKKKKHNAFPLKCFDTVVLTSGSELTV